MRDTLKDFGSICSVEAQEILVTLLNDLPEVVREAQSHSYQAACLEKNKLLVARHDSTVLDDSLYQEILGCLS